MAGAGAAVLILAALAYQGYSLKTDADANVASLKKQSAQVTQNLASLQKASKDIQTARTAAGDRLQKLQTDLTNVRSESAQVEGKKMDYSVRIVGITQALPEGADYLKIDMNPSSSTIAGTTKDPFDVVAYTVNLEKQAYFPTVRLTKIAPVQDDPATFTFGVAIPK